MRMLHVNMAELKATFEELPREWNLIGGRGLIAKIMNRTVPFDADPLGAENKLVIACGPLAGTMAPELGRISVGGKSPLTLGIKEANAGGTAAQKLDRLGIRAVIVEGAALDGELHCLKISRDEAALLPADRYRGMKNYQLADELRREFGDKCAVASIGIAGERRYKAASVSFTDMQGRPCRSAARGGLGAVMGAKGIKAIIVDDSDAPPVNIADEALFRERVKEWVGVLRHDVTCGLFSRMGTPYAVPLLSYHGTMPEDNYTSGRPKEFGRVTGEVVKRIVWERGGRMHACMPGCVVQCSIIYNDAQGRPLAPAYEYEGIAMLGTNIGIADPDAIAQMKYMCDDLGIDFIEAGSSLSVAASAGRMTFGDADSAFALLAEIESGTSLGHILADGVVSTAKALNVSRIPAYKGQAIPGHDPRAAKGIGVTYATSPMGADHTAGLTYRVPSEAAGQKEHSLRAQVQAAVLDTFGYCLNALPGGRASLYQFLADLVKARFGQEITREDVEDFGKETLRDELRFNKGVGLNRMYDRYPAFVRREPLPPKQSVFDVEDSEIDGIWDNLETFREPSKIWEVRFPQMPSVLFGAGVIEMLGERASELGLKKALLIADPVLRSIRTADRVQTILRQGGVDSVVFSEVEPDPPIEEVERIAGLYREQGCDGLIALGGGSSLDAAKGAAVRLSQPGPLTEYESVFGGTARIKPPLPPLIGIPTTSGTGSEVNHYAVITDRERDIKFAITSEWILPRLAVIDPALCATMPPKVTAETGLDALAHCIEGYVGMASPYHPYYEALALYGVKLVGRSLRTACADGRDLDARADMCMAALNGGLCLSKGLGVGHAIGHALGAMYHIPHGKAVALGLLCFVRANREACQKQFSELALALDGSDDIETPLVRLYEDVNVPTRLRHVGIPDSGLPDIAFETSKDAVNLARNPAPISDRRILELLRAFY